MSKPSSEFWNELVDEMRSKERDHDEGCGCKHDREPEHEPEREPERECDHGCDSDSARALKKILSLLDELNNKDLRLLDEIIDRILCDRKR